MQQCPQCGLQYQCVCSAIPKLDSSIPFSLLMHENEYLRETNTGKWLLRALPQCQDYCWKRTEENPALQERVSRSDYLSLLVYPSEDSIPLDEALKLVHRSGYTPHFIILDGTWQEAKKIERKSPWLNKVQRVHLTPTQLSNYQLRRNQSDGHLCTLEVVSEILQLLDEEQAAQQLTVFLDHFSRVYQADKSGHIYVEKTT